MAGALDLSGTKIGSMIVQRATEKRTHNSVVWVMRCTVCGCEIEASAKNIKRWEVVGKACPACAKAARMPDDYALGILWATSSKTIDRDGEKTVVRNEDPHFAEEIAHQCGGTIYTSEHPRKGTILYCVVVPRDAAGYAGSYGLTGRTDKDRIFPAVSDPWAFARAYIQCHSSITTGVTINRRKERSIKPKLSIFGAEKVIDAINQIIASELGCGVKKPNLYNGIYTLSYQSPAEVQAICEAIVGEPRHSKKFEERFIEIFEKCDL